MIISEYVKELQPYTKKDLKILFKLDDESFKGLVENLKKHKIIKVIKRNNIEDINDLIDIDLSSIKIDNSEDIYIFKFVGIVMISNLVIKVLPKYLKKQFDEFRCMKQILEVLRIYNSKQQTINSIETDGVENQSVLAIAIEILKEFNESGLYLNYEEIVEINGEGEILWNNTIESKIAIINRNRPYYLELDTQKTISDENSYISRLHAYVVTECTKKLKRAGLLEIFDLPEISISDEEEDNFGEKEYIRYMIRKEIDKQFITTKQKILKLMDIYFNEKFSFDKESISVYGSTSFNLVWEDVCAKVFNDRKNSKLKEIKLVAQNIEKKMENKKLIEIIEKPKWIANVNGTEHPHSAKQTLKPDLLAIYKVDEKKCFGIFDAKYYNIELNENEVKGNPGVGDLIKQYLYQLAYKDFLEKNQFDIIKNAFFMPHEGEEYLLIGKAKLDMFLALNEGKLEDILVVKLPSYKMFEYYIKGKKINIQETLSFLGE